MKKILLVLLLLSTALLNQLTLAQDDWQGAERIVAVGDIHGDYDGYLEVLKNAGLVNRRGNWIAGETHFVQLGDLPDRGPDTDKIIKHMQKIESQADRDGGHVHALIGNHEAMNVFGDLRYVHPGEYEALRTRRSGRFRDLLYEQALTNLLQANPEFVEPGNYREEFDAKYPLGFVEHRSNWSSDGEFGSWVLQHDAVVKVNRSLFLHGGISPELLAQGMTLTEINQQVRRELGGELPEEPGLTETQTGPLWYRGLASNDEAEELPHVDAVLAFYDVDHIVIGHTPGMGTIVPRFGGKVLVIDVGISEYYGSYRASLAIEGDELFTLQNTSRVPIPQGDESLLPYYRALVEEEPVSSRLRETIMALEADN